jgi:hypothetical protein
MAGERHGTATYPGIGQVEFATYTTSRGLTPGVAVLRCQPGIGFAPAQGGTLKIGDDYGAITILDCKLDAADEIRDENGVYFEVRLRDRRWKWLEFGAINGCYNQLDPHGKLIPRTVRSPKELAILCLEQAGEVGYTIDMPPGLKSDAEANGFLGAGENLPPTGTNPPINWYGEPPMQALQRLCDQFGRQIVLNPTTNTVHVVVPGTGADLPPGSIYRHSPGIKKSSAPDIVAVMGSPTRFQCRFLLQAVGKEWDGSYRPINFLSYRPRGTKGQVQETWIEFRNANSTHNVTWMVFINGVTFQVTTVGTNTGAVISQIADKINASTLDQVEPFVDASTGDPYLILKGKTPGKAFNVQLNISHTETVGKPWMAQQIKQVATSPTKSGWGYAPPPLFPGVQATDRLTLREARELAQSSVWRCYQLINLDVSNKGKINVPGYGEIKRREQIVLHPTMVDQVVPEEFDPVFKTRDGEPLINNYYNGYSRDKPARVIGSISIFKQQAIYTGESFITKATDQVHVPFSIDPVYQVVTFSDYVYTFDNSELGAAALIQIGLNLALGFNFIANVPLFFGHVVEPRLILETSCGVRDPDTNQLVGYLTAAATGQTLGTDAQVAVKPDVQLNITCTYRDDGTVKDVSLLDADAVVRAKYYVDGMMLQFPNGLSETAGYNGIVPAALDGALAQATWTVGPQGAETTISRNTEHHIYVPPYPERRRQEMLPPAGINKVFDKIAPMRLGERLMGGAMVEDSIR